MAFILRNSHVARVSVSRHIRLLATPTATSGSSAAPKEAFKDTLEQGPSLDDFISGGGIPERVVLGNTKTYVTLLASE
jgi:lipoic acid synthetase